MRPLTLWVVFVISLVLTSSFAEARRRKKGKERGGDPGLNQIANNVRPEDPYAINNAHNFCRKAIFDLANRKDLPRLFMCAGDLLMVDFPNAKDHNTVYRWPSISSGCSKLSDLLFTASAGCDQNAFWMFYVTTGHVDQYPKATIPNCPGTLTQAPKDSLVSLQGGWADNLQAFRTAMNQHRPRSYIFAETGITSPYHYWIVLQTPNTAGTSSTFEVISGFANSWRVIDFLKKNQNIPMPTYAGAPMTQTTFEQHFLAPLEALFTEVMTHNHMTNAAKAAYRSLWAVEGWGTTGKPQLRINYAPATEDGCRTYMEAYIRFQNIPDDARLKGAAAAVNIDSKSMATTRANACQRDNICSGQYTKDGCAADLARIN